MLILEITLLLLQAATLYRAANATIWDSHREDTESVKVLHILAGMASVLTAGAVWFTEYSGLVDTVPIQVKAALMAVLMVYSLLVYQVLGVFENSRIKKRRSSRAAPRPKFS